MRAIKCLVESMGKIMISAGRKYIPLFEIFPNYLGTRPKPSTPASEGNALMLHGLYEEDDLYHRDIPHLELFRSYLSLVYQIDIKRVSLHRWSKHMIFMVRNDVQISNVKVTLEVAEISSTTLTWLNASKEEYIDINSFVAISGSTYQRRIGRIRNNAVPHTLKGPLLYRICLSASNDQKSIFFFVESNHSSPLASFGYYFRHLRSIALKKGISLEIPEVFRYSTLIKRKERAENKRKHLCAKSIKIETSLKRQKTNTTIPLTKEEDDSDIDLNQDFD